MKEPSETFQEAKKFLEEAEMMMDQTFSYHEDMRYDTDSEAMAITAVMDLIE